MVPIRIIVSNSLKYMDEKTLRVTPSEKALSHPNIGIIIEGRVGGLKKGRYEIPGLIYSSQGTFKKNYFIRQWR